MSALSPAASTEVLSLVEITASRRAGANLR